jgi:hypothetical protein
MKSDTEPYKSTCKPTERRRLPKASRRPGSSSTTTTVPRGSAMAGNRHRRSATTDAHRRSQQRRIFAVGRVHPLLPHPTCSEEAGRRLPPTRLPGLTGFLGKNARLALRLQARSVPAGSDIISTSHGAFKPRCLASRARCLALRRAGPTAAVIVNLAATANEAMSG